MQIRIKFKIILFELSIYLSVILFSENLVSFDRIDFGYYNIS